MTCPQCGRPRASEASHGLCPACLFATAASMADDVWTYQVLAPIEQDALGITYLAERDVDNVRAFVALKVVVDGDGEAMRSRFHALKPALARLQHPGAAKVLDAGSAPDGSAYIASEYVAGPTLSEIRSRQSLEGAGRLADALGRVFGRAARRGIAVDDGAQHQRVVGIQPEGDLLVFRPRVDVGRLELPDVVVEPAPLGFERAVVDESIADVRIENQVERSKDNGRLLRADGRCGQQHENQDVVSDRSRTSQKSHNF